MMKLPELRGTICGQKVPNGRIVRTVRVKCENRWRFVGCSRWRIGEHKSQVLRRSYREAKKIFGRNPNKGGI